MIVVVVVVVVVVMVDLNGMSARQGYFMPRE